MVNLCVVFSFSGSMRRILENNNLCLCIYALIQFDLKQQQMSSDCFFELKCAETAGEQCDLVESGLSFASNSQI